MNTLLPPSPFQTSATHSLARLSPPLLGSGDLLLSRKLKQVTEDLAVLVKDNRSNLKLSLQSLNLLVEGVGKIDHLQPLLYLLEEFDQTVCVCVEIPETWRQSDGEE